jgi:hypothetical protein
MLINREDMGILKKDLADIYPVCRSLGSILWKRIAEALGESGQAEDFLTSLTLHRDARRSWLSA